MKIGIIREDGAETGTFEIGKEYKSQGKWQEEIFKSSASAFFRSLEFLPVITTVAPFCRQSLAVANPIPPLEPVM